MNHSVWDFDPMLSSIFAVVPTNWDETRWLLSRLPSTLVLLHYHS